MLGTSARLYTSLDNKTPSNHTMLQAYGSIVLDVPYIKFGIQFYHTVPRCFQVCMWLIMASYMGCIGHVSSKNLQ